jgi:hypothetical protein
MFMSEVAAWAVRILAGLLLAGLIAPFTLALPERWQAPGMLVALAVVCVAGALLTGRRRSRP